ncbi:MAG: HPr kinase/phosphatase C-terminal domain-containing protein [Rhodobacteraceae bacterium]|nr:HPr kinase/phosphatase C-terminal domain-containing protein [Paracoccaceae bacterium]
MPDPVQNATIWHAGCVAFSGRSLVITGASGTGKSALTLTLMAYGAGLVADDRVRLERVGSTITARAPDMISGLIEARFVGLLNAEPILSATVAAIVDLNQIEPDRLPPSRHTTVLGQSVPLFHRAPDPIFAPALMQFLKAGRKNV